VNEELGTCTAVITHNAVIAEMAHRVVSIASGAISAIHTNTHRAQARELAW
jgi:putative ABC transport system ATP-binding protein